MDYFRLIKNWHERAGEEDYFSKFVFEYLAFIAYLKTQKYRSEDPNQNIKDREAIQRLKRDEGLEHSYLAAIGNNDGLRTAWGKIKTELDNSPLGDVSWNPENAEEVKWWNCSHNNSNEKTAIEKQKVSGVLHSLDDWENMVEFWYTIRNNLFHGGKDPEGRRDQLVVEFGYKTLRELVSILIEE
jgi:hypothetical protein